MRPSLANLHPGHARWSPSKLPREWRGGLPYKGKSNTPRGIPRFHSRLVRPSAHALAAAKSCRNHGGAISSWRPRCRSRQRAMGRAGSRPLRRHCRAARPSTYLSSPATARLGRSRGCDPVVDSLKHSRWTSGFSGLFEGQRFRRRVQVRPRHTRITSRIIVNEDGAKQSEGDPDYPHHGPRRRFWNSWLPLTLHDAPLLVAINEPLIDC